MHKVTLVLAYLICVGHGRRLQGASYLQSTQSVKGQAQPRVVQREDGARLLQPLAKFARRCSPNNVKLLARISPAINPSAAFRLACPGAHFLRRIGSRNRNEAVASSANVPNTIAGVSGIAAQYDAFLLDQFGVLHDGSRALPGAVACFNELIQRGVRCVVLSNTSRRKADAMKKLGKLGFDSNALTGFICSGEEAWQFMASQCAGKKILWLGWEDSFLGFDNAGYLRGLDVQLTSLPEEADYVLAQGTQLLRSANREEGVHTSVFGTGVVDKPLKDALRICQERGIPMLCANPDFQATQPDGSVGYMPGIVAEFYESIGGKVLHFGKPFKPAFNACIGLLTGVPHDRICHVGDSLHHDIKGANDAGIDSLFITTGIHKDGLPSSTDPEYSNAVRSLCSNIGARPTFVAQDFVW